MTTEITDVVRTNLVAARKAAGLTQAQVGEALGVTEACVLLWEKGRRDISLREAVFSLE